MEVFENAVDDELLINNTLDYQEVEVIEEEKKELLQILSKRERSSEMNQTLDALKNVYNMSYDDAVAEFSDAYSYFESPMIVVQEHKKDSYGRDVFKYRWRHLRLHVNYFMRAQHKRYIPRLRRPISRADFITRYMMTSTPVIIPFENMRNLGWKARGLTMEDLQKIYPVPDHLKDKPGFYKWQTEKQKQELDLGPGLLQIAKNEPLTIVEKNRTGRYYNFPRNFKIEGKYLQRLGITNDGPGFLDARLFQLPSVWMGSSKRETRMHHDCCDNFNAQIMGTKKWILAPPTDSQFLYKNCLKGLCWSNILKPYGPDSMSARKRIKKCNFIEVDLLPGEMLYIPGGWFHHVRNEGPTLSVNYWVKNTKGIALLRSTIGICKDLGWKCINRELRGT